MSQPATATGYRRLSDREVCELNLLKLLAGCDTARSNLDGRLWWLLDASDICELIELAADLLRLWCATTPLQAWTQAAELFGVDPPADDDPPADMDAG